MPEVNGIALMKAVRAVDEKIWALKAQIDQSDDDDPDADYLEDEMLSYMKAADDLRVAYEQALRMSNNLPAYEKLVREY